MDHLYNYVPGQATSAATPGHICTPVGPHDVSAVQLAPCVSPENERRDRRSLSFIDSITTTARNASACFLQSVWCAEGRPQDAVTGVCPPGATAGTPASGGGARPFAGKGGVVIAGAGAVSVGAGVGGGGDEREEASAATLQSFPSVPAEHVRGSYGAGGLTTTESQTSTDIVGISNVDAARLTHPYAPHDRPCSPADWGRGERPWPLAKREATTPLWAVTQPTWSASSTRRGLQASNQQLLLPPLVEVPAGVRYAHPGYFSRPLTAAERCAEEEVATPLPASSSRGAHFWHPVYAGETDASDRSSSPHFSIWSEPSSASSRSYSRPGSANPRTMLAPTRAPPPQQPQHSTGIAAVLGDRRTYDLHHRLPHPCTADVVRQRDGPQPVTGRPPSRPSPLPPSSPQAVARCEGLEAPVCIAVPQPPRASGGWAASAGGGAGVCAPAQRSPGGGPSLSKTRTPAMAGDDARGPAPCCSTSALSWPDGSVYEAQRLDCQSPRELVDATFLVAVPLVDGAPLGECVPSSVGVPSHGAASAAGKGARPASASAETLAPPTTTTTAFSLTGATTDTAAAAAVAVLRQNSRTATAAVAQASVGLCSPAGTCIPVVPLQLPLALQPVPYASDPHQATAAHTLLEALHRPSKRRGRRSPAAAAATSGNGFVPAMLLASCESATASGSGGSGHATPFMSHVPTPPPRPGGTPVLRAASAAISSPGPATHHPPLATHHYPQHHRHHHHNAPSITAAAAGAAAMWSGSRQAPRVPTSGGISLEAWQPSWCPRKMMLPPATTTPTATATTTDTTVMRFTPTAAVGLTDGTDVVHSVVGKAGRCGSNLAAGNRPIGKAFEVPPRPGSTHFSSVPSHPSSSRPFRPGESAAEVPSMLSLVDIGIAADVPSPHKSSATPPLSAPPPPTPPPQLFSAPAHGQPSRSMRTANTTRGSRPPSLVHHVSFADSTATSVRERAISHMECGAQPEPDETEDGSFYQASLMDVASRMTAGGPLSTPSEATTTDFVASAK